MGKYALWRRSRLRRGGLRPGGALVRKRPGVPHRPVVGRRARRGGRGTAVDRNGARRGESLFGWRRVQRNVRLRLCPLGENYRREPHFGHGVHRARYAGACAPARERGAVQYGVFCIRAACAGERGRGFRVRLARRERTSRGKPALPVQGCARDAAVQRAVGLSRNGRALPLRRRLRRSPPRLPGVGRGVPAGKRGGNAARHSGCPRAARHRAGQRSAGKDKGVVGAARAGRKVFRRHAGERAPSRAVERVCRALLPRAGQRKPLPERRRGRLPGSAAGPHQPSARRRRGRESAHPCVLRPPVRGGRRAALVPSDRRRDRQGRAHRLQRRSSLAAVGGVRICAHDRRREPLRGNRAVSYFAAARARRAQPVRNALTLRRDRHGARPLPPRRGARAPARYRRAPPAADGRRRLERRL